MIIGAVSGSNGVLLAIIIIIVALLVLYLKRSNFSFFQKKSKLLDIEVCTWMSLSEPHKYWHNTNLCLFMGKNTLS